MALETSAQRRAFASLVSLVHRGLVTVGDIEEFEDLYARLWNSHGMSIGQFCGFGPWARTTNVPESWMAANERLRHQDPSEQFLRSSPEGTPFITSTIWSPEAKRTEIYREFVGHDYADSMVQRFSSANLGDMFSVILRLRGARPFDTDDEILARAIHASIGGALATRAAQHALGLSGAQAPAFHAHVSFPRLDVSMDERARRGWSRIIGEPLGTRGLRRVERLIEQVALDFFGGKPGVRSRAVLPTLAAECAWVPPERGESRRVLVLFFDMGRRFGVRLDHPAAELLSPAQRRVGELAANGLNNVAIARTMKLSVETVRSHLKEAMRRLGVSSRAELVAFTRSTA